MEIFNYWFSYSIKCNSIYKWLDCISRNLFIFLRNYLDTNYLFLTYGLGNERWQQSFNICANSVKLVVSYNCLFLVEWDVNMYEVEHSKLIIKKNIINYQVFSYSNINFINTSISPNILNWFKSEDNGYFNCKRHINCYFFNMLQNKSNGLPKIYYI